MKLINLDQSGPDWHAWRADGIGGSDACAVSGAVQWTSPDELLEVKLGWRTVEENEAMRRGKRLEPEARAKYIEVTGNWVRPVCAVHDQYEWMRASLDGLSRDGKLIVEIKCPLSPWPHKKALWGRVPDYYKPQLQHQLAVTGAERLHYFSYTDSEDFPVADRWALILVERDEEQIQNLIKLEKSFWDRVVSHRKKKYKPPPDLLLPVLLPDPEPIKTQPKKTKRVRS